MDLDTLRDVMSLRMGSTVARQIRKRVGDERVAQMLDHFVQYVGSSPYWSPAVLCCIAHMQTEEGVWYPMGGTRAVPEALTALAERLGVDIRTGTGVARILRTGGRASGVETEAGERCRCRRWCPTWTACAPIASWWAGAARSFAKRLEARAGLFRRGAVSRPGPRLRPPAHHDFVFSRDPEEEFDYIYRRGEPAPDPTCYIAAPARTEPGVAPPGGEALYVLVHTPYLRPHHDWNEMLPATAG